MVKVLIIGDKGRVAQRHIKAWKGLGIEWVGCDKDADYHEFINRPDINLIDICTPIYLHAPMIMDCLNANKDIICEKPVAHNLNDAEQILRMTKDWGKKIGIVYQFRFNPQFIDMKKKIQEGYFGKILMVNVDYFRWRGWDYYKDWEYDKERAGGGVVLNICIHYFDLLQNLFGMPTKVFGLTSTSKDGLEIENNAVAILKFSDNVLGSVRMSSDIKKPLHCRFTIFGDKRRKTYYLKENEYHKEYFRAFINGEPPVDVREAIKSLKIVLEIMKK